MTHDYDDSGFEEHETPAHPEEKCEGTVVRTTITSNPNCRIYYFCKPVVNNFYIWRRNNTQYATNDIIPSIDLLQEVNGIEGVMVQTAYSVWITKGLAFDWDADSIESTIFGILKAHDAI